MIRKFRTIGAAGAMLLSVSGAASAAGPGKELVIDCPRVYPGDAIRLASPKGWEARVNSPFVLNAAGVIEGPLAAQGVLRPLSRAIRNGSEDFYDLSPLYEHWVWCGYGDAHELHLSKRLPDAMKQCTVTFKRNSRGSRLLPQRVACE